MINDSPKLKQMINSFKLAEKRVNNILFDNSTNSVQKLKIKLDNALKSIDIELKGETASWATKDLEKAYNEGGSKIGSLPTGVQGISYSKQDALNPYIEISNNISKATQQTRDRINKIIDEKANNGITSIYDVKQAIKQELREQNGNLIVHYNNGAKVPLSAYASMVARTERIVTENTGSFNRCKELGIDLVRCTKVPDCCEYCKRYEDKVYSISGKDNRFPALYGADGPLKNGYNIMHPNCRHEFLPFVEKLYTIEEINNLSQHSNTFINYSKDDKIFKTYQNNQSILRRNSKELSDYRYLKRELGEQLPYKTLGDYRKASRYYANRRDIPAENNVVKGLKNRAKIRSKSTNKTIHEGRQGKHIQGHNNYKKGQSYISISLEQCQQVVNEYAGTGKLEYKNNGSFNNKERIVFNKPIGWVLNLEGKWVQTKRFKIHYSKSGTHIVPTLKGNEDK